ncbi:hypothetical protein MMC13_006242 [Lambiella insularis]|nr:hypothetical protein [Lambiella insularis]
MVLYLYPNFDQIVDSEMGEDETTVSQNLQADTTAPESDAMTTAGHDTEFDLLAVEANMKFWTEADDRPHIEVDINGKVWKYEKEEITRILYEDMKGKPLKYSKTAPNIDPRPNPDPQFGPTILTTPQPARITRTRHEWTEGEAFDADILEQYSRLNFRQIANLLSALFDTTITRATLQHKLNEESGQLPNSELIKRGHKSQPPPTARWNTVKKAGINHAAVQAVLGLHKLIDHRGKETELWTTLKASSHRNKWKWQTNEPGSAAVATAPATTAQPQATETARDEDAAGSADDDLEESRSASDR